MSDTNDTGDAATGQAEEPINTPDLSFMQINNVLEASLALSSGVASDGTDLDSEQMYNLADGLRVMLKGYGFENIPDDFQATQQLAHNIVDAYGDIDGQLESADNASERVAVQNQAIASAVAASRPDSGKEPDTNTGEAIEPSVGQQGNIEITDSRALELYNTAQSFAHKGIDPDAETLQIFRDHLEQSGIQNIPEDPERAKEFLDAQARAIVAPIDRLQPPPESDRISDVKSYFEQYAETVSITQSSTDPAADPAASAAASTGADQNDTSATAQEDLASDSDNNAVTAQTITQAQSYLYVLGYGEELAYTNSSGDTAYIDGLAGGSTREALEAFVSSRDDLDWDDYADMPTEQITARLKDEIAQSVADADREAVLAKTRELAENINVEGAQHAINAVLAHDQDVVLSEAHDIGNNGRLLTDGAFGPETQAGLEALQASVQAQETDPTPPTPGAKPDSHEPDIKVGDEEQSEQGNKPDPENEQSPDTQTLPSPSGQFAGATRLLDSQPAIENAQDAAQAQYDGSFPPQGESFLTLVDAPGMFQGKVPVLVDSNGLVREVTNSDQIPDNTNVDQTITDAIRSKIQEEISPRQGLNPSLYEINQAAEDAAGHDGVIEIGGVPFDFEVMENNNELYDIDVKAVSAAGFERELNGDLQADATIHLADGTRIVINDIDTLRDMLDGVSGTFENAAADLEQVLNSAADLQSDTKLSADFSEASAQSTAVLTSEHVVADISGGLFEQIKQQLAQDQYHGKIITRGGHKADENTGRNRDNGSDNKHEPATPSPDSGGMMV